MKSSNNSTCQNRQHLHDKEGIDLSRVQAYLQTACSTLNFDIGEIWCCDEGDRTELRFVQLYTSPAYDIYREVLLLPNNDGMNHFDVSNHRFSPDICATVKDGGQLVWANTSNEEGLLGRSDLPLRTAVGSPICCIGDELCILVLFSPFVLSITPDVMDFLYTLSEAASRVIPGFLPVSETKRIMPAMTDVFSLCDHHKSKAIKDSLSKKSIELQMYTLGQVPSLANRFRENITANRPQYSSHINNPTMGNTNCYNKMGEMSSIFSNGELHEAVVSLYNPIATSYSSQRCFTNSYSSYGSEPVTNEPLRFPAYDEAKMNDDESDFLIWFSLMDSTSQGLYDPINQNKNTKALLQKDLSINHERHEFISNSKKEIDEQPKCFFQDPYRRSRFEEFISGLLDVSIFQASDCWLPDDDSQLFIACSSIQCSELAEWSFLTSQVIFKSGVGPVGRIYQSNEPQWFTLYSEIDKDKNPLVFHADQLGIKTAFGVPIPVGDGKSGVILFYSMFQLESSDLMIDFVRRAFLVLLGDIALRYPAFNEKKARTKLANFHISNDNISSKNEMALMSNTATNLGRVAGSYDRHAEWQEMQRLYQCHFSQRMDDSSRNKQENVHNSLDSDPNFIRGDYANTKEDDFTSINILNNTNSEINQDALIPQVMDRFNFEDINSSTIRSSSAKKFQSKPMEKSHGLSQSCSSKRCYYEGCTKAAQGSTHYCIAHGGGRRCTFEGCSKGARDKFFCAAHGGGKRCQIMGCKKAAVGGSSHCTAHGGGKRCTFTGCTKSAQSSTPFCVRHGGGRLCSISGCEKVARGRTKFCAAHGGGQRCNVDQCHRVAIGKKGMCRVHSMKLESEQYRNSIESSKMQFSTFHVSENNGSSFHTFPAFSS